MRTGVLYVCVDVGSGLCRVSVQNGSEPKCPRTGMSVSTGKVDMCLKV